VGFAFLGVIFCLDFSPFFFPSLLPLRGVFIYLFIYLCSQPYDETIWEYF
jgi:hypothetical protein